MTELKVWVDRVQRVISGVTPSTTTSDIIGILSRTQMLSSAKPSLVSGGHTSSSSQNGPRGRDCLVLRQRGGLEHVLSPNDRPLRLLAHSGGHLIYRPAAPVTDNGVLSQASLLQQLKKPGVTHVQLRSQALETALKRQNKSAPGLTTPALGAVTVNANSNAKDKTQLVSSSNSPSSAPPSSLPLSSANSASTLTQSTAHSSQPGFTTQVDSHATQQQNLSSGLLHQNQTTIQQLHHQHQQQQGHQRNVNSSMSHNVSNISLNNHNNLTSTSNIIVNGGNGSTGGHNNGGVIHPPPTNVQRMVQQFQQQLQQHPPQQQNINKSNPPPPTSTSSSSSSILGANVQNTNVINGYGINANTCLIQDSPQSISSQMSSMCLTGPMFNSSQPQLQQQHTQSLHSGPPLRSLNKGLTNYVAQISKPVNGADKLDGNTGVISGDETYGMFAQRCSQEASGSCSTNARLMNRPPPYEQAIRSSCRRRPADLDILVRTQQEKLNFQQQKLDDMDREIAMLESNLQNREKEHVAIYPECQDLERRLTACESRLNLAQKEEASIQTEIYATKSKIDRLSNEMELYMSRECELVSKALDIVATPQQDLPLDEKHRQIVACLEQELAEISRQTDILSDQLKIENLKGLSLVSSEELAEGTEGVGVSVGTGHSHHGRQGSSRRKVPPKGPRQLGQEMASPTQTHPIGVWV